MRKSLAILFLFASLGATGLARADDDDCVVPMAQWQPVSYTHLTLPTIYSV